MLPGLNPASSRLYHQDHSQRNRMAKTSVRHSTLQQCSNNNFEIFVVAHNSFVNFNDTLNMGAPKCGGPPNVGGPGHVPLLPRPKSATVSNERLASDSYNSVLIATTTEPLSVGLTTISSR